MARVTWDVVGSRYFEAGVDRGVLYVDALPGVPWTGLISVDEAPSGAEAKAYYIDGIKYLNLATRDEFEGTIQAYTYPTEFSQCDGTSQIRTGLFFGQQNRKSFGFTYRTMVGNDVQGPSHAYKIHLVYNALATPSGRAASSYSSSVEPNEFSWSITTRSRVVSGTAPTAHIVIDTRYTHPITLAAIEDILYGNELASARLPTPEELIEIYDIPLEWEVIDLENGTFEVSGPEANVHAVSADLVEISHPDVDIVDADTFTITY